MVTAVFFFGFLVTLVAAGKNCRLADYWISFTCSYKNSRVSLCATRRWKRRQPIAPHLQHKPDLLLKCVWILLLQ